MFGDLDWPLNTSRGFVSISWASCFLQARCPSCRPTNSVKALKGISTDIRWKLYKSGSRYAHSHYRTLLLLLLVVLNLPVSRDHCRLGRVVENIWGLLMRDFYSPDRCLSCHPASSVKHWRENYYYCYSDTRLRERSLKAEWWNRDKNWYYYYYYCSVNFVCVWLTSFTERFLSRLLSAKISERRTLWNVGVVIGRMYFLSFNQQWSRHWVKGVYYYSTIIDSNVIYWTTLLFDLDWPYMIISAICTGTI